MITPRQFNNGQCIIKDGEIWVVLYTQHKRTAQRRAEVRTKMRNIKTGAVLETNLQPDELFEEAFIEKKPMTYLYSDGDSFVFMDQASYEQFQVTKALIGEPAGFMKENMEVTLEFFEGKVIGVLLPIFIDLKVTYTEPGLKGDTARGGSKPATLETGATVKVPLFIDQDDIIRIDTRTGEYEGRV